MLASEGSVKARHRFPRVPGYEVLEADFCVTCILSYCLLMQS
jgi:hypothetical protein